MKARHLIFCAILTASTFLSGNCSANKLLAEAPLNSNVAAPEKLVRLTGLLQRQQFSVAKEALPEARFQQPDLSKFLPEAVNTGAPAALPDTIHYQPYPVEMDRSGRTELITSSLAYSLLYYGWAVPTALDADGGRPYVASYLLLGGAGFFVPFLATRHSPITQGMARGFTAGAGLGIAHGWALTIAIMGDDIDGKIGLGTSVATSIGEGLLLMNYAKKQNLGLGHMSMIGTGGSFAGLIGLGMPAYFKSESARAYAASGLIGSGLGMWAGDYLARKIDVADGDAQIVATTGILGTYLSLALATSTFNEFNRGSLATVMAGTAAGLGLGILKIRDQNYSTTDANLITLGSLAGGLIGLGVVYIAAENSSTDAYLWGSGLGALGGFILTDKLIAGRTSPKLGNLKIQFNPMAFRNLIKPLETNQTRMPNQFGQAHLVNASLRF